MLRFETIVCPVDFSEHSSLALKYAVQLATQYESRLVVYHSVVSPVAVPIFPDRLQGGSPTIMDRNKMLENYLSAHVPVTMPIVKQVESVPAVAGILQTSENENADLIVMGTHGATGYEALFLGSVTQKVLHKSRIPVLTVCRRTKSLAGAADSAFAIRRILCAVEPTQMINLKRIHIALSLARAYLATLVFFQVRESVEQEATLDELKELMQPEKEEWCKIEYATERGHPRDEILKAIDVHEADLLVIGHHVRRPGALEVLGSIAFRVIPQSPCPVLVVRD
ncbi:MAG TPA: universal stress protein [Acidobacteriota bacterium]|nr:universal stress protein [Acidobacteriota bacterium]